jgi:hypothetical protein
MVANSHNPRHDKPHKHNKPDNPDQYRRFVETARELGADESPDAMDRAFGRVEVRKPKSKDEAAPADKPKRR